MKIAVTEWHGRVAPLFDVAGTIVLADADGAPERLAFDGPGGRVAFLKQHGVDVLICGAISPLPRQQAETQGIQVQAFVSGEIRDVLEAFKTNRLDEPDFTMPGCRRCRRRRRQCH